MRVSLNWLRDYVDIDMDPETLGNMFSMRGLEVEGVEHVGRGLKDVVAAEILAVTEHPSADRLFICQVDGGRGKARVVCGASNLEVGAMVPLALPGAELPDGTLIQESRIKGEKSSGMLLAEDEMGLSEDHSGIMILPPDLTPGASIADSMALADWVLVIGITPNRSDCNAVIGVAREIAALTGGNLRWPPISLEEQETVVEELTSVRILDPEGCPRYAAGLIQDVQQGPSPFWLRYRLHLSGIRSINNLVDVTNYVMLETGQPLHAFDYHRLRENRIEVRRAHPGERFTTLDGKTHELDAETLMICDAERAVALAGIMGGLNSEIFEGTKDVLVESAFFDPVTVRRGSRRMGISTEASYRFERTVDIQGVSRALRRALALLAELSRGKVVKGIVDNYPRPYRARKIRLDVQRANRFLGTSLARDSMRRHLESLEIEVEEDDTDFLAATPPSFRPDITREVDLTEEVARLDGYDNIPITYPRIRPSEEGNTPEIDLRDRVRAVMVSLGFSETISYSFIAADAVNRLGVQGTDQLTSFVELLNPLSIDQAVLRTSLAPGLLSAVKTNFQHDQKTLKLFEWGKVFFRQEGQTGSLEKNAMAAVMSGWAQSREWYAGGRAVDFYDLKGVAEALLQKLGVRRITFHRDAGQPWYASDASAAICVGGQAVGRFGRVASEVSEAFDVDEETVYLLELDIARLSEFLPRETKFEPFTRFPAVYRDISLLVKQNVESGLIIEIIKAEGGELIERVDVFDLYQGDKIDPSEKAIAIRICYRSRKGTLDGDEVNSLHDRIVRVAGEKIGGKLREG